MFIRKLAILLAISIPFVAVNGNAQNPAIPRTKCLAFAPGNALRHLTCKGAVDCVVRFQTCVVGNQNVQTQAADTFVELQYSACLFTNNPDDECTVGDAVNCLTMKAYAVDPMVGGAVCEDFVCNYTQTILTCP